MFQQLHVSVSGLFIAFSSNSTEKCNTIEPVPKLCQPDCTSCARLCRAYLITYRKGEELGREANRKLLPCNTLGAIEGGCVEIVKSD